MKKLIIIFITLLSACTTSGPAYRPAPAPPEGQALVYVFRDSISYGGAVMSKFFINEKKIVQLYDKGYTWVHVPAGKFELKINIAARLKISGSFTANETYYFGVDQKPLASAYSDVLRRYSKAEFDIIAPSLSYKPAIENIEKVSNN